MYKRQLYINLSTKPDNNNCLNELILKLQDFSNAKLFNFILENYDSVWDVAKKSIFELIKIKAPGLDWFFDILYNSDIVFLSKTEEKSTSLKIIEAYIDRIIDSQNLCIIIDNFTYCDKKSFSLLSQLFYHYIDTHGFKAILVTTSDVLKERTDIQILLTEQMCIRDSSGLDSHVIRQLPKRRRFSGFQAFRVTHRLFHIHQTGSGCPPCNDI